MDFIGFKFPEYFFSYVVGVFDYGDIPLDFKNVLRFFKIGI